MSSLYKHVFVVAVSILLTISSSGQSDNVRIYDPPNYSFKRLKLETHMGIIRLGYIDVSEYAGKEEMLSNYSIFKRLLSVKKQIGGYDPKIIASYDWDKQMNIMHMHPALSLAGLIDNKIASQYFKNFKIHRNGLYMFDFQGVNSIEKKQSREKFVENFLEDLAQWPSIIAKNGFEDAYYVTQDIVDSYDSENGGISLFLGFCNVEDNNSFKEKAIRLTSGSLTNYGLRAKKTYLKNAFFTHEDIGRMPYLNYKMQNLFEQNVDRDNMVVFFSIEEDKANELLKSKHIFIVRKIRFFDDFSFHINSPKIELYSDKGLANKVGELDYNDLIFY